MSFRNLIQLILLAFSPILLQGQNMEAGLFAGASNYQGDLVDGYVEMKETNLAYGAFLRYYVHNNLAVRVGFLGGRITGDDRNSSHPLRRLRGAKFQSDLFELGISGEWHIMGQERYDDERGFKKNFSPYLYMGLAIAYTDPVTSGEGLPELEEYPNSFFSIPVGGGFKYSVHEMVCLGFEGGFRPAFSDYLDGVSLIANPKRKDWYMFLGMTLTFKFGGDFLY